MLVAVAPVDIEDRDDWRRTRVADPVTPHLRDSQPEGERECWLQLRRNYEALPPGANPERDATAPISKARFFETVSQFSINSCTE